MKKEILIIGQGIAGTSLAFSLLERGHRVQLIDDGHLSSSSKVAAGMWNPASFKKLSLGWKAAEQLQLAEAFYIKIEEKLGIKFYHPMQLYRIFPDQHSANEWDEKSAQKEFSSILSPEIGPPLKDVKAPFGYGIVKHAGWCNLPAYLQVAADYFRENNMLVEEKFEASQLDIQDEKFFYEKKKYDRVVLSIGYKNQTIPYFENIPIYPNKGQVLTLSFDNYKEDKLLNYGNFLLPVDEGKYRLGATYEFNDPNPDPTIATREKLLEKLTTVLPTQTPHVLEHKAGYRPTVPDRKPTIGEHHSIPKLYLFNGFGSKAVMYVPYCLPYFIDLIENGTPVPEELDLYRFKK
ncbi:MAG: FAD-dependent oxidoreductase [Flavobacteriales bacterium]